MSSAFLCANVCKCRVTSWAPHVLYFFSRCPAATGSPLSQCNFKVGKILECKPLEGSEKLYVEQIDLGEVLALKPLTNPYCSGRLLHRLWLSAVATRSNLGIVRSCPPRLLVKIWTPLAFASDAAYWTPVSPVCGALGSLHFHGQLYPFREVKFCLVKL